MVSITPAQYFSKKRGLANDSVCATGGVGGTVTAFMMNALIQWLGPAWTFRILGFMILGTGLPAALLIRERSAIRTATSIEWSAATHLALIESRGMADDEPRSISKYQGSLSKHRAHSRAEDLQKTRDARLLPHGEPYAPPGHAQLMHRVQPSAYPPGSSPPVVSSPPKIFLPTLNSASRVSLGLRRNTNRISTTFNP
ncbi:MAG: hypothetical protein L6R37_008395 [Teloschistes peruensis]|nr:MAG: hypothetical protein L6R37_008395 [Teloschistes peruensis]